MLSSFLFIIYFLYHKVKFNGLLTVVSSSRGPACCVGVGCVTRGPQVSAHGPVMMLHILVITSPGPGPPRTLASRARLYKFLQFSLCDSDPPGRPLSLSVRSGQYGAARTTSVPGRVPPPPLAPD